MNTPITDRARIKSAGFGFEPYVSIETARALERIAGELADAGQCPEFSEGEDCDCRWCVAIARYQAMKDEATK